MKLKKNQLVTILLFFVLLTTILIHNEIFTRTAIWEVPRLLNKMRAKEFCSCIFVLGEQKNYCLNSVRHGYPIMSYLLDRENKIVRFDLLWDSQYAEYTNKRFGCQLK